MGIKIGIDLGTTFCACAVLNEKTKQPVIIPNTMGEKITPSVIQFTEDGEIIVGSEAKEAFESGEPGCATVFKRGMGKDGPYFIFEDKEYTAVDLSAILLRYLKEEVQQVTHQTVDEAVVTVPAYFYHKERNDTMEAARKAGLKIHQIINEPTAAAMNYGVNHWRTNARVMVYDLGGGTFDVTLVQMMKDGHMESLRTIGNHSLGGKDWDERIVSMLLSRISADTGVTESTYPELPLILTQRSEEIKKQLTARNTVPFKLRLPDYGTYSTEITIEEFEKETQDLLYQTGSLCQNLLDGLQIDWSDVTDILLVGGSTRMRQVSSYLQGISGHKPLQQVNPDEAVALGAAIQVQQPLPEYNVVAIPSDEKEPEAEPQLFKFRKSSKKAKSQSPVSGPVGQETYLENALSMCQRDVVAHAMGAIAVNKEGTHYINKTIIPAYQQIPVKCAESFHFYTAPNSDNELEIYMLQGTAAPLDCNIIGKYVVEGITHNRSDNPTTMRIQYSYDVNGMVHVQARQGNSSRDLPIRSEPVPEDMSMFGRPISQEQTRSLRADDVSIVMAVDVSGSMDGAPMQDALNAMCHFVDQFRDYPGKVEIGVIAVSDKSLIVQSLSSNMDKCVRSIRSITCGMTGYCNEAHPFGDIRSILKHESGRKIGIVLADGMWERQNVAIQAARDCHDLGIDIVGIGFGCADEKFLKAISSGDIDSMLVQQSELTQSFGKIAQEISGGSANARKGRADNEETSSATWLAIGEN